MKKITHFKFEAPKIIGILSDKTVPANVQRRFDNILKRRRLPCVCLPFRVETKYLKNVVGCMRLMDIKGLIIIGNHEKRIGRFVNAGKVNVISRSKNRFRGYFIENKKNFYKDAVNLLTSSMSKKR